jgi:hypothetical protein
MGSKHAKKVDLERLSAALPDFPFAYLITVDNDYRVHTVTVEPVLRPLPAGPDGPRALLDVGAVGGHTRDNLAQRSQVTLLFPPREAGGYSLIVDGAAELVEDERCGIVPSRALLHREADPGSAARGTLHDCVVFR